MTSRVFIQRAKRDLSRVLPMHRYLKYRTQWELHRHTKRTNPVLVYSLGKVGTTSLTGMLRSELGVPVVHCHRVAERPTYTKLFLGRKPKTTPYRSSVAWRGDYIRRRLTRDTTSQWEIVCGVRDPVARAVSAMFEVGVRFGLFDEGETEADKIDNLTGLLSQQFLRGEASLDWFEVELGSVTDIDVYAEPFPCEAGYRVYEQGRFRVLLFRYEDLNRVGPNAISQFFDIDVQEIPRSNSAVDKTYSNLYRAFKDQAALPVDLLDAAYNSRLATNFYTEAERAEFRNRWIR